MKVDILGRLTGIGGHPQSRLRCPYKIIQIQPAGGPDILGIPRA